MHNSFSYRSIWDEKIMKKSFSILFICSGNIIRSAYTDLSFKKMVEDNSCLNQIVKVDSGAVEYRNQHIYRDIIPFLKKNGIDQDSIDNFIPKHIEDYPDLLKDVDVILTMTNSHISKIPKEYINKTQLLYEFVFDEPKEVIDPYFHPPLDKAITMLDSALEELLKILVKRFC